MFNNLILYCFLTGFEVNFMDDVGQTLLNWASAFGTQEMVSRLSQNIYQELPVLSNLSRIILYDKKLLLIK